MKKNELLSMPTSKLVFHSIFNDGYNRQGIEDTLAERLTKSYKLSPQEKEIYISLEKEKIQQRSSSLKDYAFGDVHTLAENLNFFYERTIINLSNPETTTLITSEMVYYANFFASLRDVYKQLILKTKRDEKKYDLFRRETLLSDSDVTIKNERLARIEQLPILNINELQRLYKYYDHIAECLNHKAYRFMHNKYNYLKFIRFIALESKLVFDRANKISKETYLGREMNFFSENIEFIIKHDPTFVKRR